MVPAPASDLPPGPMPDRTGQARASPSAPKKERLNIMNRGHFGEAYTAVAAGHRFLRPGREGPPAACGPAAARTERRGGRLLHGRATPTTTARQEGGPVAKRSESDRVSRNGR